MSLQSPSPTSRSPIGKPFAHWDAAGRGRKIVFVTAANPVPGTDQVLVVGPLLGRPMCVGPTTRRLQWQGYYHQVLVSPAELEAGVKDERPPLDEGWD